MPEEQTPYFAEGERVEARGIIIERVGRPTWTKDGKHVCVEMTDDRGQTRLFAWPIETAEDLAVCLMSGVVGSRRARKRVTPPLG